MRSVYTWVRSFVLLAPTEDVVYFVSPAATNCSAENDDWELGIATANGLQVGSPSAKDHHRADAYSLCR